MKKPIIILIVFALLSTLLILPISADTTNAPTRIINVVYDDSGSMYRSNKEPVDTWCQAKYSMEVFAAMLGDSDYMNVYYMSDYEKNTSARPRIVLSGSDGAETNVSKIHLQTTRAGNTPFNSVRKAYKDLSAAKADEKWLVILTDGEFEDGRMSKEEIDDFLASKDSDVRVMFLGMGANAAGITDAPNNDIYYVEAKTNNQILNKITEICTRIFNSNKLEISVSSKTFNFDVPMSELIVFAQGANVSINGIKTSDGTLTKSTKTPVAVKYSDCDATNYSNLPTTDLLGSIATFKDDFVCGEYSVDVTGAETIEIYYKPNIEIAVYLVDSEGNEVTDLANLAAGEYTIKFGFVKAGTNEKVEMSKLLGDVEYSAFVTNNGEKHEKVYSDGDKIILKEGDLDIDATALYLEYNTVSTSLHYSVFKDKEITFEIIDNPTFEIGSKGFLSEKHITVKAKIDGQEFNEEQWATMEVPKFSLSDAERNFKIENPIIEKTSEPGIFIVTPVLPDGKPSTGTYSDCEFGIYHEQKVVSEVWKGSLNGTLKLKDTRSWWERNWDKIVKFGIAIIIFLFLIGYLPFIKNYLPKSLKSKPYIKCIPSQPGEKRKDRNGSMSKNFISTIIPYVSQKGEIKYVPKGVTGAPLMKVKAIKHRRMTITNYKAFAGKDNITFDGESIKKDCKKFDTGAGVTIKVIRGEWTYICSPNQTN